MVELWIQNSHNKAADDVTIREFEAKQHIHLPESYKELIRIQNGGLIKKNHFQTSEPTSYGMDSGEIYGIAGINHLLAKIPEECEIDIPGQQIYFHQDKKRYIGFSYLKEVDEPEIIYIDFETLQILSLATNFKDFLANLYFSPFDHDRITYYPRAKLDQMLSMGNLQTRKEMLFALEDEMDKVWYLNQLIKLVSKRDACYDKVAISLLENQVLYFKRKLPHAETNALFTSLLKQQTENEQLINAYKAWHSTK